jgi:hypothetical protein
MLFKYFRKYSVQKMRKFLYNYYTAGRVYCVPLQTGPKFMTK